MSSNAMRSERTKRRLRMLFDKFDSNLRLYTDTFKDAFVCPLCHRAFPREALQHGYLSKAHIVPQFLGGKRVTLLCKECNNSIGSRIEGQAHLGNRLTKPLIDGGPGVVPLPFTLRVDDELLTFHARLSGSVVGTERVMNVEINGDLMNPQTADKLQAFFESWQGGPIPFDGYPCNPGHYDPIIAAKLDVSIAFLSMFDLMGYEFALSPIGLAMRELLRNPQANAELVHVKLESTSIIDPSIVLALLSQPVSFLVVMPPCKPFVDGRALWVPPLLGCTSSEGFDPEDLKSCAIKKIQACDLKAEKARSFFHLGFYQKRWSLKFNEHGATKSDYNAGQ